MVRRVPREVAVRTRAALLGFSCLVLAGCSQAPEVIDFGAGAEQAPPPVVEALDATLVDPPAHVPPADAQLAAGGWPEAAAMISREAAADRPTLVNIFASWCGPCRAEMPLLTDARRSNPEVAFLGINHLDRLADAEAFVSEFKVDFPTLHDLAGDVAFAVGSPAMPTTVLFDRDGKLVARVVGELTPTTLERLLDEVR